MVSILFKTIRKGLLINSNYIITAFSVEQKQNYFQKAKFTKDAMIAIESNDLNTT